MTEEQNVLSITDFAAGLRIVEQQQVEETAVEVIANRLWRHPDDPDIFVVRINCPLCSRVHRHGWAGPPHKPGYRAAQCPPGASVEEGYTLVIPDDLQATEEPIPTKPSWRKRNTKRVSNRLYKNAIDELKVTDWAMYRAVACRVESLKGVAAKSQDRAAIAESRVLILEAQLNARTEQETN